MALIIELKKFTIVREVVREVIRGVVRKLRALYILYLEILKLSKARHEYK